MLKYYAKYAIAITIINTLLTLLFSYGFLELSVWHYIFGYLLANLFLISFIVQCIHKNKCFIKMDVFFKRMMWVDQIDEEGFVIIENSQIKHVKWGELMLADIDTHFKTLSFFHNEQKTELPSTVVNWYKLIKGFEKYYDAPDLKNRIKDFFDQLTSCEICGYIACYNEECQVCASKQPKEDQKDKLAYIFQNQLKIFTPAHPNDAFNGFYDEDDEFDFNKSWQPLINYDDIKLYAKKNYKLAL